jgi:hypothetical protein
MTGDDASRGGSFIEKDRVDVLLEIASDPNLAVQIDRGGMSTPRKFPLEAIVDRKLMAYLYTEA